MWRRSSRTGGGEGDRCDAMLQRGIRYRHHCLIRSQAVRLDDDAAPFTLGRIEEWAELIERDLLFPEVNGRHRAAGDADDLLIELRRELEFGEGERNGNSGLENEVGAEEEKKDEQENDVDQWKQHEPAEVIFLRLGELHFCELAMSLSAHGVLRLFSPPAVGN